MTRCWKCGYPITSAHPGDDLTYTSNPPQYAHERCPMSDEVKRTSRQAILCVSRQLLLDLNIRDGSLPTFGDQTGESFERLRGPLGLRLPDSCRITGMSWQLRFDRDQVSIRVRDEAFIDTAWGKPLPEVEVEYPYQSGTLASEWPGQWKPGPAVRARYWDVEAEELATEMETTAAKYILDTSHRNAIVRGAACIRALLGRLRQVFEGQQRLTDEGPQ